MNTIMSDFKNRLINKQNDKTKISKPEINAGPYCLLIPIFLMVSLLCGCGIREASIEKIRDMEFTVLAEDEIPVEYLDFIMENKSQPMKLTYCTEDYLYIAVGYGQQETGGYSISVDDFYLTENGIYIDTTLHGPSVSETSVEGFSYPYIVVKTELMDVPVIFQ